MLRWLYQRQDINVSKDVGKREALCNVHKNVNWHSYYQKQYESSSKKLKIELPYHPAIPILGKYPKEIKLVSQRNICTLMFIAA